MNSHAVFAAIGLGSNLGDREANLAFGRAEIARHGFFPTGESSIYETDPVGPVQDQGTFLNQVIIGETELPPLALLAICLHIERERGRKRTLRWGPRTLDLDLLLYGDTPVNEPGLVVPHPHLKSRGFVLTPLAEIAPEQILPGDGRTIAECLAALSPAPEEGIRRWRSSATKPQI